MGLLQYVYLLASKALEQGRLKHSSKTSHSATIHLFKKFNPSCTQLKTSLAHWRIFTLPISSHPYRTLLQKFSKVHICGNFLNTRGDAQSLAVCLEIFPVFVNFPFFFNSVIPSHSSNSSPTFSLSLVIYSGWNFREQIEISPAGL